MSNNRLTNDRRMSTLVHILHEYETKTTDITRSGTLSSFTCPTVFRCSFVTIDDHMNSDKCCKYANSKTEVCVKQMLDEAKSKNNEEVLNTLGNGFDRTMFCCTSPYCVEYDSEKINASGNITLKKGVSLQEPGAEHSRLMDANKFHIGCHLYNVHNNSNRGFLYKNEKRLDNNDKVQYKGVMLPVCSNKCRNIVLSMINKFESTPERKLRRKIFEAIERGDCYDLSWETDNITANGQTSMEVLMKWLTEGDNARAYFDGAKTKTGQSDKTNAESYDDIIAKLIKKETSK